MWFFLLACTRATPQAELPAEPVGQISPSEDAVYRALSVRDPVPSCADIEALSDEPVAALLDVVDNAPQPPWAGMRAAGCLIDGHAVEAADSLRAWMVNPGDRGLAILLIDRIDRVPDPLADELVELGLSGPHAEDIRARVRPEAQD